MSIQDTKKNEPTNEIVLRFQQTQSKVQEMSKSLADFMVMLQSISSRVEDLHKQQLELSRISTDNSRSNLNLHNIAKDRLDGCNQFLLKLEESWADQQKINIQLYNQLSNLDNGIQGIVSRVSELPNMKQFIDVKSEIDKTKNALDFSYSSSVERINTVESNLQKLKSEFQTVPYDIATVKEKLATHDSSIIYYGECYNAMKNKLNEGLASSNAYVDRQLDARIPKTQPTPLITKEDVQKLIKDTHEGIKLDASNAHLKASNNDMKLVILEKKIEQLQLTMNKIQLGG